MNTLHFERDKDILKFHGKQGEKLFIGSKLYPLSRKKNIGLWKQDNTEMVDKQSLLMKVLQQVEMTKQHTFTVGKCYTNAEVVRQVGEKLGLKVKYYSGWVFPNSVLPVHHAWVVLDDRILIDTSMSYAYIETIAIFMEQMKEAGQSFDSNTRKEMVDRLSKVQKNLLSDCVYGYVPKQLLYVGTEDTRELAIKRYNDLMHQYPQHPSYQHKNNPDGASETQRLMQERGMI